MDKIVVELSQGYHGIVLEFSDMNTVSEFLAVITKYTGTTTDISIKFPKEEKGGEE